MKIFAVLAATAFAVASAQTVCDTTALVTAVTAGNGAKCTAETTYQPALLQIPTGEVLAKVCASDSCKALLAEVTKIATPDCTFSGKSVTTVVLAPITKACEDLKASSGTTPATTAPAATTAAPATTTKAPDATPATTTKAPTATTAAPATTTEAPAATTEAPAEEEKSSASGSSEGEEIESPTVADETKAPASANATTPAPAKASSATSVATAAGAVVVAVAASLF